MADKSTVSLLLGAGFSQGLLLPGVAALTDAVIARAEPRELSAATWETLRSFDPESNFETLFHALETLYSITTTRPTGTTRAMASAFATLNARWDGVTGENLVELYRSCLGVLHGTLTDSADAVECSPTSRYEGTAELLDRVRETFALRVFDLNYDDVAERMVHVVRDGFTTDATSRFNYSDLCCDDGRVEWCHVHGSIRFEMVPPGSGPKGAVDPHIVKHPSRHAAAPTFSQTVSIVGQDSEVAFMGPIISSLRKLGKGRFDPFGIYHHRFVSALLGCPRLIVIGYGGNDTHISDWLYEWRRVHRDQARLVWVTYRRDGREPRKDLNFPRYAAGNGEYRDLRRFSDGDFAEGEFRTPNAYVVFTGSPPKAGVIDRAIDFLVT
jgi:hypothetical protein